MSAWLQDTGEKPTQMSWAAGQLRFVGQAGQSVQEGQEGRQSEQRG